MHWYRFQMESDYKKKKTYQLISPHEEAPGNAVILQWRWWLLRQSISKSRELDTFS
jgi:hypothetical protein